MTVVSLDHVQLAAPAGCESDARRFFGEIVGLDEIPKPPALAARGGVWFSCGEQQLHVGVEPEFAPARKAHPAFRVRDLESLRERFRAADVATRDDEAIPDVRRFYADDPFGNRLEFVGADA
jgi:catechol 2,3-dioxygenase-like lactoylglutathione lyase family enzyme